MAISPIFFVTGCGIRLSPQKFNSRLERQAKRSLLTTAEQINISPSWCKLLSLLSHALCWTSELSLVDFLLALWQWCRPISMAGCLLVAWEPYIAHGTIPWPWLLTIFCLFVSLYRRSHSNQFLKIAKDEDLVCRHNRPPLGSIWICNAPQVRHDGWP